MRNLKRVTFFSFPYFLKQLGILAILAVTCLPSRLASSGQVTDTAVAQGCQSDVLDIFDNSSNLEIHTRAESVTYDVFPFGQGSGAGIEVRGFVTGTGFAPFTDQGFFNVLEHFQYQLPFKVWYMLQRPSDSHTTPSETHRGETLVGFLHGYTSTPPGRVEVEWLANQWLKDAMLKRGITFLAYNQTGRNENGDFTARLANGTPVQPINSSPHIRNSTCAVRNLLEKLKGRSFDQTILIGHSAGANTLLEMTGGYTEDGRQVGIARDAEGRPDFEGMIVLAPAFGFGLFGFSDPEPTEPVISSKLFFFGFTGDSNFGREVFDATEVTLRLLDPACPLSSCDPASWMRVYRAPPVFPEAFLTTGFNRTI
jgi:hypothetical protein